MSIDYDYGPSPDDETQQEQPDTTMPSVHVTIDGPTRVQDLPTVIGSIRTVTLPADNSVVHIANADLRRRSIRIVGSDQPYIIGLSRDDVNGMSLTGLQGNAGKFPISVVIPFTGIADVWAKSGTNGTAATIAIIEEDWTE